MDRKGEGGQQQPAQLAIEPTSNASRTLSSRREQAAANRAAAAQQRAPTRVSPPQIGEPPGAGPQAASVASAYFETHSAASLSCFIGSDFSSCAISGTRGSSGLGSFNSDVMLRSTLLIVSAGDHCALRMSRQMLPLAFTLQW